MGVYDFGRTKKDRVDTLKSTLRGIQRVPTILLNNPTESLTQINLEGYTVLDCEPLHDIKGHFENLLLELPHVLESTLSAEVRKVLKVDLWDKTTKRGADYRVAMIHTLSVLQRQQTPTNILQVVETAVDISSILYQEEIQRSPKAVLRLYNKTWLHFELCKELFSATSTVTHQKFFGIYLHALTLHAPPQYEILNLKSANTEHEERLFGQAKQIVNNASNRHPNNVIPNILLRLQAKQMKKDLYKTYHESASRISKAASILRSIDTNTCIPKSFLTGRMSSWQEQLKRISSFLILGPGVWWREINDGFEFFDGRSSAIVNTMGPSLEHFRQVSLEDVYKEKETTWNNIIKDNVQLPTFYIKLYSADGQLTGYKTYREDTSTHLNGEDIGPTNLHTGLHVHEDEPTSIENEVEKEPESEQENDIAHQIQSELEQDFPKEFEHADSAQPFQLQTKLAIALSKVVGSTKEVQDLDKVRHRIKTHKALQQEYSQHAVLLCHFRQQLKQKRNSNKQALKLFESTYFKTHQKLPNPTENSDYKELLHSSKLVLRLLTYPDFKL